MTGTISGPWDVVSRLYRSIKSNSKIAFYASAFIGFITHAYFFTNRFTNEDDISLLDTSVVAWVPVTVGRWLAGFYSSIRYYHSIPFITGFLAILWLSLAAAVVVLIFDVRDAFFSFLIGAFMSSYPTLCYGFAYLPLADVWMLSVLLSVLAVYLARFKYGYIGGGCCLALSLSIYQYFMDLAIGLILLCIFIDLIKLSPLRILLNKTIRFIAMGVIGGVLYYVSVRVFLQIFNLSLSEYKGANTAGNIKIQEIPSMLQKCYAEFASYFLNPFFPVKRAFMIAFVVMVFFFAICFAGIIIRMIKEKKIGHLLILFGVIPLFPLGINFVGFLVPSAPLTALGVYPFIALIFLALLLAYSDTSKLNMAYKWAVIATSMVMVANFVIINNVNYLKLHIYYERTFSLTSRILDRIEQLPEFENTRSVFLHGNVYAGDIYIFREFRDPGIWGPFVGYSSQNYFANTGKFISNASIYHGVPLQVAPNMDENQIGSLVKDMPVWPAPDSVAAKDGIIVVNLSQYQYIDIEKLEKGKYLFSTGAEVEETDQFAWYVYDGNARIDVIWYRNDNTLEYTFEEPGEYAVQLFCIDASGSGKYIISSDKVIVE